MLILLMILYLMKQTLAKRKKTWKCL